MELFQYKINLYANLSSIVNEIFYGGYYSALGSPLLIFAVSLILNIKMDLSIYAIAYLLTLLIYSYDYYRDLNKDLYPNSQRANYLNKKSTNFNKILFSYLACLAVLILLTFNFKFMALIGGMILAGVLYSKVFKNLTKKLPLFKNIYTALIWTVGGTFFIIIYNSLRVSTPFLIMFLFIFLRVLINIIFFDLKDLEVDRANGIKTLFVLLGKRNSILILHIMNILSFIPLILGIYYGFLPIISLSLLLVFFYVFYFIEKTQKTELINLDFMSHLLAESEFLIWTILLLTSQFILNYSYII